MRSTCCITPSEGMFFLHSFSYPIPPPPFWSSFMEEPEHTAQIDIPLTLLLDGDPGTCGASISGGTLEKL